MYNKTSIFKRRLVHEKFIIIILSGGYVRTSLTVEHNKISFLKQFLVFNVGLDCYVLIVAIGQTVVRDILGPLLRCGCG